MNQTKPKNPNKYTYEITKSSYAREHALHCLSMRPDDFVEYGKVIRLDSPNQVKSFIQQEQDISFVLAYEYGQLVNNVFVVKATSGGAVHCFHGISAPINGSMSYMYGTILLDFFDFLSSEGYSEYSQDYIVDQGSGKVLRYYADKSTKYNFYFNEKPESFTGKLLVDLVNLKGET